LVDARHFGGRVYTTLTTEERSTSAFPCQAQERLAEEARLRIVVMEHIMISILVGACGILHLIFLEVERTWDDVYGVVDRGLEAAAEQRD
jgi:hypothetical protein